ncbi:MAG TPA: tetratricopeptide repeat protein [Candidatus Sulfotelmatobacter sp.]|nr:tetratricopeptide repeat protein [Candidatus Sulfotelmatobacter sp.]
MSGKRGEEPSVAFAAQLDAARSLAQAGNPAAAIEAIEAALESASAPSERASAANALADVATACERARDYATAERALDRATRARGDFADLQCRHARALLRLDRRREARRALERALKLQPRFVEARLDRALLDAREGNVGEALDVLRTLAREGALDEPQTFQLGIQSLERGDWDEADSLLRRSLQVAEPGLAEAITEVRTRLANDDATGAAEQLTRLLERHPAYPDLHALLGAIELQRGHPDDAMSALARAIELNPDFHDARALLARSLEALGAFSAAAEQAALVLEHDPEHAVAREIDARWSGRRAKLRARRPGEG